MPLYKKLTLDVSGATASNWIPLNQWETPFNVGIGVDVSAVGVSGSTLTSAAGTYVVEHTFDDILVQTDSITAFRHDDLSAQTVKLDGNYAFPVAAVRLRIETAGSGTATMWVRQSDA